jgi:hypothetical protein
VKAVQVRARLTEAVTRLNATDGYLLQNDLSERCIASRLAMYLQPLFPDHVVDVEYNRAGDIPKRLNLPDECANFRDADGRSLVVPDIIVHTRGPEGPNVLVVELKKTTNRDGPECDRKRVPAFVSQLGYACGALVLCETRSGQKNVATITDWCQRPEAAEQPHSGDGGRVDSAGPARQAFARRA